MSPRKILIFSLAYYPIEGGAEIAVKEITSRINANEIEFDIVTLRFDYSHPEREKIGNCTVYRIDTSKNLYPFKAFFLAKKLHRDKSYDCLWAVMANWAGFAALFFKLRFPQVPYVLTLQEGDPIPYIKRKVWFIYPLFKKIFLYADVIQVISKYLADWAQDMGYKGRVEVIPNGVNTERFENQNPKMRTDIVTLITTSRLVEKNAVGDIIDALGFLPENVSLKILGEGPLESELKLKAKKLKSYEARVEFLGHVPNDELPKYLHEADIFIRPSLSEGMGNSFIEAMAAGLPVIATAVGGIVDFLRDGETGLFCQVKNPASIATQVRRLLENENLKNVIVENAKKMVKEKYDWDLIVREMKEKIFDKV